MESSFNELRCKEVINVVDGKSLGRITDIIFDVKCGKILGLVVPPVNRSFISFLKGGNDIFIPYQNICKFGADVILVEMYLNAPFQAKPGNRNEHCDKRQEISF